MVKVEYTYILYCDFNDVGDAGFPLNSIYSRPSSAEESDLIRQYFLQLRHETGASCLFHLKIEFHGETFSGQRVCEKVFDTPDGKPSKWWTCFAKKRFMEKSLSGPGGM